MADYNIQAEGLKIENPDILGDVTIRPAAGESVELTAPTESGTIARTEDLVNLAPLVDDVVPIVNLPPGFQPEILLGEYIDETTFNDLSADPYTPATDKLYVDTGDNKVYRWTGITFIELVGGVVIGTTSASAGRGDHALIAYNHSQIIAGNPHGLTPAMIGLGNVNNTSDADKEISTATNTALNLKRPYKVSTVQITDNHTLILSNRYNIIESTSATPITITIPPDIFEVNDTMEFVQIGTGQVSFAPGVGVTLRSTDNERKIRKQNGFAFIYQRALNDWVLSGDITV